jgi:hypothetical protein
MKHRTIWPFIITAFAIALILSFIPRSGEAQRIRGPAMEWARDIKIPPVEGMQAIRLINKPVERGEFSSFANKVLQKVLGEPNLKIGDERIGWADDYLAWINRDDPSSLIMQDAVNGNLSFSNRMTKFVSMENPSLPKDGEAQELALAFIKDLGLMPGDFETNAVLLHVGGLFSQDLENGEPGETVQKLITLHWGREVNGIPVQGPGSKLVLQIGHNGEVVGFNKKWNPMMLKMQVFQPEFTLHAIEPIRPSLKPTEGGSSAGRSSFSKEESKEATKPAEFYSPEEVKDVISKVLQSEWASAELIEIRNVSLVYYDRSGDYIQPAYAVEAIIHAGGEKFNYLHHVAAMRQPPEPIYLQVYTEPPRLVEKKQEPTPSEFPSD